MTAEIAEKLRYQGEDVAMCTNPLNDYFAMGGTRAFALENHSGWIPKMLRMIPSTKLANFRFCRLLNFFVVKEGCVTSRLNMLMTTLRIPAKLDSHSTPN